MARNIVSLAKHQSAIIANLQGGINFIQRMPEKGIRVGVKVERVGIEEFVDQPLTTRGRNRGRNKGRGLGENQVFIRVKGNVINLGRGEAVHIFVRLNTEKTKK